MVQALAKKLDELLGDPPNYGRGKECDCVLLLLAHLYNYKVIYNDIHSASHVNVMIIHNVLM